MKTLTHYLDELGISATVAAKYLDVSPRTFRRWLSGESLIKRSVFHTLDSWCRFKEAGLKWEPEWKNMAGVKLDEDV